jgi:hypothetical protein
LHPQQDEDAASHTNSKPGNIDECKTFMAGYISEGDF